MPHRDITTIVKKTKLHDSNMLKLESNFCMEFPKRSRNSPGVRFFIFVIQRFNLLLFLLLAEFGRVGEFEEFRSKLYQPFWVHSCHFSHVFFGCKHQLVIDNPVNIVKLLCMLFLQNITFIFKQTIYCADLGNVRQSLHLRLTDFQITTKSLFLRRKKKKKTKCHDRSLY